MRLKSGAEGIYGRQPQANRSALSLTPLIDVVFILLLFFILVTSSERWQSLRIDTATSAGAETADLAPSVLWLTPDAMLFEGREVTPEGLARTLRRQLALKPALRLVVQTDDSVPVQRLVAVLDQLRLAGLASIRLVRPASP